MPTGDVIDLVELRQELIRPGGLWQKVDLVAETGSTNADLAARARQGEVPGTVLITDYQSAGRGRQGRTWTAPPGSGIAMSILVTPGAIDPNRWTWLSLLAGLAVSDGVRRTADLPAVLKWPNDVLVAERKVCGILSERVDTPQGPACVVGIGINVGLTDNELPVPTATSLAIAARQFGIQVPSSESELYVRHALLALNAIPSDRYSDDSALGFIVSPYAHGAVCPRQGSFPNAGPVDHRHPRFPRGVL